jgi:hypothetical protein
MGIFGNKRKQIPQTQQPSPVSAAGVSTELLSRKHICNAIVDRVVEMYQAGILSDAHLVRQVEFLVAGAKPSVPRQAQPDVLRPIETPSGSKPMEPIQTDESKQVAPPLTDEQFVCPECQIRLPRHLRECPFCNTKLVDITTAQRGGISFQEKPVDRAKRVLKIDKFGNNAPPSKSEEPGTAKVSSESAEQAISPITEPSGEPTQENQDVIESPNQDDRSSPLEQLIDKNLGQSLDQQVANELPADDISAVHVLKIGPDEHQEESTTTPAGGNVVMHVEPLDIPETETPERVEESIASVALRLDDQMIELSEDTKSINHEMIMPEVVELDKEGLQAKVDVAEVINRELGVIPTKKDAPTSSDIAAGEEVEEQATDIVEPEVLDTIEPTEVVVEQHHGLQNVGSKRGRPKKTTQPASAITRKLIFR